MFRMDGEGRLVINATHVLEDKVEVVVELGNEAGVYLPWSKFAGSDLNVYERYLRSDWCG